MISLSFKLMLVRFASVICVERRNVSLSSIKRNLCDELLRIVNPGRIQQPGVHVVGLVGAGQVQRGELHDASKERAARTKLE